MGLLSLQVRSPADLVGEFTQPLAATVARNGAGGDAESGETFVTETDHRVHGTAGRGAASAPAGDVFPTRTAAPGGAPDNRTSSRWDSGRWHRSARSSAGDGTDGGGRSARTRPRRTSSTSRGSAWRRG